MKSIERDTLGGWCMIAGAVSGLVTMAFHPSGGERPALALAVHGLALFGVPLAFYGAWVLTRRLASHGALSELALAFYGVSGVATLLAATASGLMAPDLIARAAASAEDARAAAGSLLHYNYALNQAFAKVLVAASATAIGLWSAEIVRTRAMKRSSGIVGCAAAGLVLLALFSGRLVLNVHGFGAIVVVQSVWIILVGAELRRRPSE